MVASIIELSWLKRNEFKDKCYAYASWKPAGIVGYLAVIWIMTHDQITELS